MGKALTADSGVWNLQTGTDFNYEWLVGSTVVGKGETFTPTTAHIGDRLTLRVTAENGRLVGSATSAASTKIGYQPKVKVKVKGGTASFKIKASPVKAKKVKGTVVVKEIVKVKDDGDDQVQEGRQGQDQEGQGHRLARQAEEGQAQARLLLHRQGQGRFQRRLQEGQGLRRCT